MEEKQEIIIEAAERQFVRFGFRKTTMEDIAKTAGIGKATLYYYFKSKEEIFAAMIENIIKASMKQMQHALMPDSSPQEQLRQYANARVRLMKEKADYYAALRDEYLELFPQIQQARKEFDQYEKAILQQIFEEGRAQQVYACEDVNAAVRIVQILLQEVTERLILEDNSATLHEDIELFLDIMLKGLEVRNEKELS